MNAEALRIEGVNKSFGAVKAVTALDAGLPAGCIYGFLGPNGAGKTTTIRMIMDIIRPDSGKISILGESRIDKVKDRIGYMPEERGLYRKMTVRGVLLYLGAIKGMKRVEMPPVIERWLAEMGLAEWADKKVEELSKGMQQKLQFVATVINDPDILILDEPFSGLDPINLDMLKAIMLDMRDAGKTVIFSTHMMEQAEEICDRLLLINQGRKVIDGTLDQIRSQYKSNSVVTELEGATSFIDDLPPVEKTAQQGKKLQIDLKQGADPQEFLKMIVDNCRVLSFKVKSPSLHEIFVHLVGRHQ